MGGLTGQKVRHDDNSMVRKVYAMVKLSCEAEKKYCGAVGERAHISRKSRGSHNVENKTLFN